MMIISKKEEESIAHLLSDAHLEPDVEIGIIKNVTSRLLVGLRWWNDIQEDGSNMWMFESHDPSRPVNPTDSHIFWVSLYAPIVIWIFFGFFALLKQWFLIVLVALLLNIANAILVILNVTKMQKRNGQVIWHLWQHQKVQVL
nr:6560_t:CDS:2 [Entrophospora candida]